MSAEAVDAYIEARMVLASTPVCRLVPQTYGPAKCQVHDFGTRYPSSSVPWCDKGNREQALRRALERLTMALNLEVTA